MRWEEQLPHGFLMTVKAPRGLTHGKRLYAPERWLQTVDRGMHGPDDRALYGGSYSDQDLRWWTDRIHEWGHMGKDVFVYFNNDGGGNAVRNADTLRWMLS